MRRADNGAESKQRQGHRFESRSIGFIHKWLGGRMYSPRVVNRVCGQTWQGITLQQGWGPSDSSPRDPDSGQSFFFFFFFYFIIPLTLKSTNRKKEKSVKNNHYNTASKIKCNPAFSLQILSQNFDLGACQIFFFFFWQCLLKEYELPNYST